MSILDLLSEYKSNFVAQEAIRLIEFTSRSLFLTGKAGTGKSTLLRSITSNTRKHYVILAPTGVAALNVEGQTIHSFFKIEPRPYLPTDRGFQYLSEENVTLLRKIDLIIIDEISMVRSDLLQAVDLVLRKNLKSDLPFAGKQLFLIGDLFQLPPVVDSKNTREVEILRANYDSPFFFSAKAFELGFKYQVIELEKVYRQNNDQPFIDVLNAVRHNIVTADHLAVLNSRFTLNNSALQQVPVITLTSTNAVADKINHDRINQITGGYAEFLSFATGDFVSDSRSESKLPAPSVLRLKKGAQVMFLKNDAERRWVNGSLATVTKLKSDSIEVTMTISGRAYDIERAIWEKVDFKWNIENEEVERVVTGTYKQFPLKLAWAVTIHKSQGQTFERISINLGSGAFAEGQTYVALSRCKTLQGIDLQTKITFSDIRHSTLVAKYFQSIQNNEMEQDRYMAILTGLEARLRELEPQNVYLENSLKSSKEDLSKYQIEVKGLKNQVGYQTSEVEQLNRKLLLVEKSLKSTKSSLRLAVFIGIVLLFVSIAIFLKYLPQITP